ncbi:hypothetical protein QE152_g40894 [Popillia japonica]|uniref:Uncharacterized protein n=1 Tax=Popillia japonica TaxID=7064 RepID=A0AAW1HF12_POPJA
MKSTYNLQLDKYDHETGKGTEGAIFKLYERFDDKDQVNTEKDGAVQLYEGGEPYQSYYKDNPVTWDGFRFVTVDATVIHPESVTLDKETLTFDLVLTKTGKKSNPTLTWTGQDDQTLEATVNPVLADNNTYKPYDRTVTWSTGNAALNVVNGSITPNLEADWIQQVISKSPYAGTIEIPVTATAVDNGKTAICTVTVNVSVINNTTSSSSGGSGGGGGGSSTTKSALSSQPAGSVTGTWTKTEDERWQFTSGGRVYTNEWAYIYNPYADLDQQNPSWFRFSQDGYMITGWHTDTDGNVYYLNPVSDNTQGRMFTGWNWIDKDGDGHAECYYFNVSGVLQTNTTIDGYNVNQDGAWVVDGVIKPAVKPLSLDMGI